MPSTVRKPTNLSLDASLLQEARSLDINLSRAAEDGVAQAVAQARTALWKQENAAALSSSNDWAARNGLPLAKYRNF
ncbi:type II toxin-antitoxin system CcdA family antitoxin [uncultured Tateyamaria sp.]|uniref:type II toxin-antitoxin system CcdA family antitoxin n=1 Tax=uncultured Tateyamaria sp. TaxID=455651 RepID=UPI00260B6351|nr:type II toxin-antitoxin system CcdA family antitoxin [uncultured Tateyamaria sp.]